MVSLDPVHTNTNPNPGDLNRINIFVSTRIRMVVSGSDSPIHTNTLENIWFRLSRRIHELDGFKKIHSGERFQKDAVSVSGFTGFVWTEG